MTSDKDGNVTVVVGASSVMFASHLDTVHHKAGKQKLRYITPQAGNAKHPKGDIFVVAQQSDCLGADDGTGIWLMMHMIEAGVPGTYCFFVDEEIGCQGSRTYADTVEKGEYTHVISFDRKGYDDVITQQCGYDTASDEFYFAAMEALGFNINASDPVGSVTDSEQFTELANECSNISVGYFGQHGSGEIQNLSFALRLLDKVLTVEWDKLPAVREPGKDIGYGVWGLGNRSRSPIATLGDNTKPLDIHDCWDQIDFNPQNVARYLYMNAVTAADLEKASDSYAKLTSHRAAAH